MFQEVRFPLCDNSKWPQVVDVSGLTHYERTVTKLSY